MRLVIVEDEELASRGHHRTPTGRFLRLHPCWSLRPSCHHDNSDEKEDDEHPHGCGNKTKLELLKV